jgi:hypothetical protein
MFQKSFSKNTISLLKTQSFFKKLFRKLGLVRVSAIARLFDDDVVNYVARCKQIEGKEIHLLKYEANREGTIALEPLETACL